MWADIPQRSKRRRQGEGEGPTKSKLSGPIKCQGGTAEKKTTQYRKTDALRRQHKLIEQEEERGEEGILGSLREFNRPD